MCMQCKCMANGFTDVHPPVCTGGWSPEVGVECPQSVLVFCLLPWNPEVTASASQSSQLTSGKLCFSSTGFTMFMSKLGIQTLVFVLGQQTLQALSCFPSPSSHSAVTFYHFTLTKTYFYLVFAKHNFQLLLPFSQNSYLMLCFSSVIF